MISKKRLGPKTHAGGPLLILNPCFLENELFSEKEDGHRPLYRTMHTNRILWIIYSTMPKKIQINWLIKNIEINTLVVTQLVRDE